MLSEQKPFLRVAEIVAAIGALACIGVAGQLYRDPRVDVPIDLLFVVGFALLMLSFLPVCILAAEYAKTVRQPSATARHDEGLSAGEISALLRWAPMVHKLIAVAGTLVGVATGIGFGSVSWSTNDPATTTDGIAGALYLSSFFMLSLPVLASAARMPGSYEESCRAGA
jgi:hypothetical protein